MRTAWLAVGLLLVAGVQAGSEEDPEITDASGDGLGPKDIIAWWVDPEPVLDSEDRVSLVMHYTIAGDAPDLSSLFALHERYRVGFKADHAGAPEGAELYVIAEPAVGTTSETGEDRLICNFGVAASEGGSGQPELGMDEGAWTGTHFICIVPYEYLGASGGEILREPRGLYQFVSRGPTAGNDQIGVNTLTLDTAPNSGYGRDFMVPVLATPASEAPALPAPLFQDIDGPFLHLEQGFSTPRTQTLHWNWTTQSPMLNVSVTVEPEAGNATFRLTAPDDQTVLECACTDADGWAANMTWTGGNGTWRIAMDLDGFAGNITVDAFPVKATAAPPTTTAGPPTGNRTTGADDGKESPAPGWLLPTLILLAVIRRRPG